MDSSSNLNRVLGEINVSSKKKKRAESYYHKFVILHRSIKIYKKLNQKNVRYERVLEIYEISLNSLNFSKGKFLEFSGFLSRRMTTIERYQLGTFVAISLLRVQAEERYDEVMRGMRWWICLKVR